jgi:hypothetical protein
MSDRLPIMMEPGNHIDVTSIAAMIARSSDPSSGVSFISTGAAAPSGQADSPGPGFPEPQILLTQDPDGLTEYDAAHRLSAGSSDQLYDEQDEDGSAGTRDSSLFFQVGAQAGDHCSNTDAITRALGETNNLLAALMIIAMKVELRGCCPELYRQNTNRTNSSSRFATRPCL